MPRRGAGAAQRTATGTVRTPAPFSTKILDVIAAELEALPNITKILDPFAGVGGVHDLRSLGYETVGIEIEREWARQSPYTIEADSTRMPASTVQWRRRYGPMSTVARLVSPPFDAIITSPTYGNRMADHHVAHDPCRHCGGTGYVNAERCTGCGGNGLTRRNTYRHCLGRDLSPHNSGGMQWGEDYRALHHNVWARCKAALKPNGYFILNISDHIRDGVRQRVSGWHVGTLQSMGLNVLDIIPVNTLRNRNGANAHIRTDAELIVVLQKP